MKEKDLGFKQDNLLVVDIDGWDPNTLLIKNKMLKNSSISEISAVSNIPGGQFNQHPLYLENNPPLTIDASEMFIDDDLAAVLELKLVAESIVFLSTKSERLLIRIFSNLW